MFETLPAGMTYNTLVTVLRRQVAHGAGTRSNSDALDVRNNSGLPAPSLTINHPVRNSGPNVELGYPQPDQWERSIRQTAILLRLATLSSREYLVSGAKIFSEPLRPAEVAQLRDELITRVTAAMASCDAAGKPVDIVQLMEWLDPLLYRCACVCVI